MGQLPQLNSAERKCVVVPDIDVVGAGSGSAAVHPRFLSRVDINHPFLLKIRIVTIARSPSQSFRIEGRVLLEEVGVLRCPPLPPIMEKRISSPFNGRFRTRVEAGPTGFEPA
jgi:hypothetical protein